MWEVENILLLLAGIINLLMSIFVVSRGWKNKINLYFSLLTFFTFFWALSLYLARVLIIDWYFWAVLAYPAAIGIAISLFYFSLHFPFRLQIVNKISHYIIFILAIILTGSFFVDGFIIIDYLKNGETDKFILYFNELYYIIYGLYFLIMAVSAVFVLFKKYSVSEGIYKSQLKILLITITVGLIIGSFFDLIICYYGNFKYVWIGPIATLFMNISVFNFIKKPITKSN